MYGEGGTDAEVADVHKAQEVQQELSGDCGPLSHLQSPLLRDRDHPQFYLPGVREGGLPCHPHRILLPRLHQTWLGSIRDSGHRNPVPLLAVLSGLPVGETEEDFQRGGQCEGTDSDGDDPQYILHEETVSGGVLREEVEGVEDGRGVESP